MTRIRKQHYIPKFYLKNFSDPIWCYDLSKCSSFRVSLVNVAQEIDFYGIAIEGDVNVETAFRKMDGKFSSGYKTFLQQEGFSQKQFEEQAKFLAFIACQYLRTKKHKKWISANYQNLLDQIVPLITGVTDWRIVLNDFGKIAVHLSSIMNYALYSSILGQMKFVVLKNGTETPFWTSDNPIAIINEFPQSNFGNLGIICRGIELHFPLTPKLSIIACDPSIYNNVPNYVTLVNENMINYENYLQVQTANLHVFSNTNEFNLIEKIKKNQINPNEISRPFPIPNYSNRDTSKPDYWPSDELMKDIWELLNK